VVSDSQSRNAPRDYVRRGLGSSVLLCVSGVISIFLLLTFVSSGYGFDSYQEFEKSKKQYVALQLEAMPDKEKVHPGDTFRLHLVSFLDKGWHMYSIEKQSDDETVATWIELEALVFDPQGNWRESPPKLVRDEVMEKIMKTHSGRVEFTRLFSVPKGLKPGAYPLSGTLHFRTCDNRICTLPQEMKFQTRVIVEAGEPG
jgi:hypothetical protein